ncbi:glycosyltransferase family 61 protein [Cognatiyoonia sp. IB215446]|uniref:glycosyltransferase family 61 protein n=1 Tax=Cognatiyoonia sp. IB215446 TaxID=3097355 RepID=UPI002A0B16BF|nr:glycosyltransferase family 61 protein [Cognatiyoonia sp. IB215446]MDX8346482.1 glycosyltransferase family 61 protein [Cognatiyoonia sp. IB215446]
MIRRLVGGDEPQSEVLQPEERQTVRPPTMLPGMLDRVTDTDEHSILSIHLDVARATEALHAPVLRQVYHNSIVRRSGFATWRHSERYGGAAEFAELTGSIMRVPELRYCHNYVNWRYFGHWLTDAIPSALIEPEQGALWMPPHPCWGHAAAYIEVLNLAPLKASVVHADRLIVYQDYGQGSHKRARYITIRDALHKAFATPDPAECVYIRRGKTGVQRTIASEAAILEELDKRGWKILDVADADVEDLQRAVYGAKVVVSIDGSHLDHAHLSLIPGSVMVVLMPGDRFSTRQVGLCQAHDVSIGFVVLNGNQDDGYLVELDEVLRTVDLTAAPQI